MQDVQYVAPTSPLEHLKARVCAASWHQVKNIRAKGNQKSNTSSDKERCRLSRIVLKPAAINSINLYLFKRYLYLVTQKRDRIRIIPQQDTPKNKNNNINMEKKEK